MLMMLLSMHKISRNKFLEYNANDHEMQEVVPWVSSLRGVLILSWIAVESWCRIGFQLYQFLSLQIDSSRWSEIEKEIRKPTQI